MKKSKKKIKKKTKNKITKKRYNLKGSGKASKKSRFTKTAREKKKRVWRIYTRKNSIHQN